MIEKVLFDFLNGEELGASAYLNMPTTAPKKYILIEKTGSSRLNRITTSTIAIQSCGPTLYDAMALNESVKEVVLEKLQEEMEVVGVRLNGDYNFTDTSTKTYRYQAVFLITHY